MFRATTWLFLLLLLAVRLPARGEEPLVGTWTLSSQVINGEKVDVEPLTLRIYRAGDGFEFAYSTPVNGIHLVSMKFVSVHLDGKEGSVQDVRGQKIGTVRVTRLGPQEYRAVIEGMNRPKATGTMKVSADNKSLTSESDSLVGGKSSHALQTFLRR